MECERFHTHIQLLFMEAPGQWNSGNNERMCWRKTPPLTPYSFRWYRISQKIGSWSRIAPITLDKVSFRPSDGASLSAWPSGFPSGNKRKRQRRIPTRKVIRTTTRIQKQCLLQHSELNIKTDFAALTWEECLIFVSSERQRLDERAGYTIGEKWERWTLWSP